MIVPATLVLRNRIRQQLTVSLKAMRPQLVILLRPQLVLFLLTCTHAAQAQTATTRTQLAAPWSAAPLRRTDVPAVYIQQWSRAKNRSSCAPFAFQLGQDARATPRAALFSGGWAVAYDRPGLRSAFGIAGTGSSASDSAYSAWPFKRAWSDGSSAGYGPEAGVGPDNLAYLRINGQGCLYNVWSKLGRDHLELLLDSLRRIVK